MRPERDYPIAGLPTGASTRIAATLIGLLLALVALCLLATAPPAQAAPGDLAWSKVYDGPGWDQFEAVVAAPNGGAYVVGDANYPTAALIGRYGAAGGRLWLHTFHRRGDNRDVLYDAAAARQGGLVAVGAENARFLTLTYAAGGTRTRVRTYRYPRSAAQNARVAVSGAGDVYVAGTATTAAGVATAVLIKYSPSGVRLWVRHYTGGGKGVWVEDLALDRAGDAYLTGQHTDKSDATGVVTLKYDAAGHRRWSRLWNGPGGDSGQAIAVSAAGTAYVAGYTTPGTSLYSDALILKYSTGGARRWVRTFPSSVAGNAGLQDIARMTSGDIVAAGFTEATSEDVLLIRLSPAGATRWATAYDGTEGRTDSGQRVAVSPTGDVVATGATYSATTEWDTLTLSYDGAGNFRWATPYAAQGAFDQQTAEDVVALAGSVYVAGFQAGNVYGAMLLKYEP